ncbi:etoposide-induced protein 2.4-like [Asterias rubens]|uniref:etoposide-induced protein 2.4-like n=1 Tax=Asterias rubens TaxID=7604 RepID=UPI0014553065|nr:etoposide-induced protein 2.4-like [Asterias rubens]
MTDSMKLIISDLCHGMRDAVLGALFIFRVDAEINALAEEKKRRQEEKRRETQRRPIPVREKKESEQKVMQRILQCCLLNGGVFWLSIVAFNSLVLPTLQFTTQSILGISGQSLSNTTVWAWMGPMMSYTFSALWVLPLFVLSRAVSSLWFQDIADAAYRKSRGRPQLPNLSELIADLLFSVIVQALFLIQSMLVSLVPIPGVGQVLSLLHLCLLNSLYAFEYKWFNMGWKVHRRLSLIELNWPYFFGFGLPLAVLTSLPSSYVIRGCLFSILFPLFIISGNEAVTPSQPCDFPLHIFSLVVEIANRMFHRTVHRPKTSR